eukprot:gene21580-biopygen30276
METIVNKEPPDKRTRPDRAAKIKDRKNGEENVVKCTLSRIIADKDNKDVITKVIKERVDSVSKRTYLAGVAVNRILKEVFEGVPDAQLHSVSVPSVDQNFIRQLMVGSRQAHMETRDATVERILAKEFKDEHGIDVTVFHRYLLYDIHSWGVKEDLIAIHSLLPERTKMFLKIQHSIIGRDEINRQWLKSVSNSAKMIRYNVYINRYLEATEDEGYAKLVNIAPIPTVKHSFITIDTDGLLGVLKDLGLVESLEKTLTNKEHWESVFDVENIRSTGKGTENTVFLPKCADVDDIVDFVYPTIESMMTRARAIMVSSHYELLGVADTATTEEIRRAYRQAALKWHPDIWATSPDSQRDAAQERFKLLCAAYEALSDPDKREALQSGKDEGMLR